MILHTRITQLFRPDLYIEIGNVNNEIYFCRGALNAAKVLNTDVFNLDEYLYDILLGQMSSFEFLLRG